MAAECGVSSAELIRIVAAGRHAADEMHDMMRALNIDPEASSCAITRCSATCRQPARLRFEGRMPPRPRRRRGFRPLPYLLAAMPTRWTRCAPRRT